jgi:hypothetical protein
LCWWPRYNVLESNKFDIYGWFWDDNNENFYQSRTNQFNTGALPDAKRVKGWWDISKVSEPLKRFKENYRLLCENAIDESLR